LSEDFADFGQIISQHLRSETYMVDFVDLVLTTDNQRLLDRKRFTRKSEKNKIKESSEDEFVGPEAFTV